MTPREAFCFGFLKQCAAEGLSLEQIEKRAFGLKDVIDAIKTTGAAGLIGATGVGALGGLGLAKLQEGTINPDDVRKQELIGTYNSYAEQIEGRNAANAVKPRPPQRNYRQ